jgi:hypothetical protein
MRIRQSSICRANELESSNLFSRETGEGNKIKAYEKKGRGLGEENKNEHVIALLNFDKTDACQ